MPTSGSGAATAAVSASTGDGARRSLRNARRLILRALNTLTTVTTTSGGNVAGTSVIATRLANAISTDRYKNSWVYPVEGARLGELRRVRVEDALNLTTGELMVGPPFSGQLESGVQVEISRLMPPEDDDGWVGVRQCINRALSELWSVQRLAITGVAGQPSYSLSTYEDWLEPDAVRELYAPAVDSTTNAYARGGFVPVRAGDSLTLQIHPTLGDADAAQLEVFRPGDTFIKVGGVWASSSVGMTNDSDEHLFHPEVVVTVALAYVYESLTSGPDGGRYADLARQQRLRANVLKLNSLDHRQPETGPYSSTPWGAKEGFWGAVSG